MRCKLFTLTSSGHHTTLEWSTPQKSYLSETRRVTCKALHVYSIFLRLIDDRTSSWRLTPKQDHLVCFLGGSLMLGATTAGALVHPVSVPPRPGELSEKGERDWKTGKELVKTCMDTHDTATCASF